MDFDMKFEWDRQKSIANLKKHKISFDEAATAFRDPFAKIFDDVWHAEHEHREILIGYSQKHHLLLISFTEREEDVVRIISARKATSRERTDYENNQAE